MFLEFRGGVCLGIQMWESPVHQVAFKSMRLNTETLAGRCRQTRAKRKRERRPRMATRDADKDRTEKTFRGGEAVNDVTCL